MKLVQSSYNLCFHVESLYVFKIMTKENTTFSSNLIFFGTFRLEVELILVEIFVYLESLSSHSHPLLISTYF